MSEKIKGPIYHEFPQMVFEDINGHQMFDASGFLQEVGSTETVACFLEDEEFMIDKYKYTSPDLLHTLVVQKEANGPWMVDVSLAMLFVCWASPDMRMYSLEKLHEIFINGFTCSDRYIMMAASRLPKLEEDGES